MQHQDFNTIIFNSRNNNTSEKKKEKKEGKTPLMSDNDTIKIESDKKLGQLLSQGRLTKEFLIQFLIFLLMIFRLLHIKPKPLIFSN